MHDHFLNYRYELKTCLSLCNKKTGQRLYALQRVARKVLRFLSTQMKALFQFSVKFHSA